MQDFGQFIEQLKDKNDIADIVSKYVPLERRGGKLWGRCPFHHEKTPSFTVNSDGQYYHCFGCGVSGDVIKFVQEMETLDFMEAVKFLCEKSGMEMPDNFLNKEDHKTQELKQQRDKLFLVLKDSARFYFSSLQNANNVIDYLYKRGISVEYIKKFGLGYSPDNESLIKYLLAQGHKQEDIILAGVGTVKNGRTVDPLGKRLIVPIINVTGDVIAFGGRDMEGNSPAKYKNTSETPVFIKSKNLYAINLVKKNKPKNSGLIIVEGYMDAIALHQAGFSNTAASMGTSLTKEQAKLIKRFCDEVYICYDGDSAGQNATIRGLDILKDAGLSVKVISMPQDTDPDEYIKEKGEESFRLLIDRAPPLSDYKLTVLAKRFNINTADGRRKYTMAAIKVIAEEDTQITKEELLKQLRDKTGLTYESLKRELENVTVKQSGGGTYVNTTTGETRDSLSVKAARYILYCLLKNKPYAKTEDISEELLTDATHIKILRYIKEMKKAEKPIRISSLFEGGCEQQENINVAECGDNMPDGQQQKYYEDCVKDFKAINYEKSLKILTAEFEQENDINKRKDLVLKIQAITMEQKK